MKSSIINKNLPTVLLKLFTIAVLLFTSSCDEGNEAMRKYGGKMTMTINGEEVSISKNSIYVYQGIFSFEATEATGQFEIKIKKGIAKTMYEMNFPHVMFWYDKKPAEAGVFTITEINEQSRTMSGTFDVTVPVSGSSDKIYIENGIFINVPYVLQKESTGNLFIANVDGVALKGSLGSKNSNSVSYGMGYNYLDIAFPYTNAPVEYDISTFGNAIHGIKYVEGLYSYKATSGTISITLHDIEKRKLEGTFNAEVESIPIPGVTKQITEGTFSFTY